mgnify:CR=1 FL=1
MNVLHICPRNSELIRQHVQLLVEGLQQSANVRVADNNRSFYQQARDMQADIIHVHGIVQKECTKAFRCAQKMNLRCVITLHGQLEPWAIKFQKANERLGLVISQKDNIEKAYAVITFGKMETSSFSMLRWNPRIEEIHNAVYTNTITSTKMATQTFTVYQKVMDSNTLEQMDGNTLEALRAIIKAGIMGDKRWVDTSTFDTRLINWRQLMVYAEHENITNYTDYGIRILGLSAPLIDTTKIAAYFPRNYTRPKPIKELVGDYQGDQTDFILRIIRQVFKAPTLLNAIELTRELYRDNVNDDLLAEKLEDAGLTKNAARLIQILGEEVQLNEGYMPIDPLNDKQTEKLRNNLKNHLKI